MAAVVLLARPSTLKFNSLYEFRLSFQKVYNRDQPERFVWCPVVSWIYLLYIVHLPCGISSLLILRVQPNPHKTVVPKVYCAVGHGIRHHFPGDQSIHFRNGYLEVYSFFKLRKYYLDTSTVLFIIYNC